MNKDINELDNQEDNKSINKKEKGDDSVSSVRRKYKRGKKEDSLVVSGNKFEKSEDIPNIIQKEDFIHYKKEVTKTIEDDYSSHEGGSSLVKKSKEEKVLPGKIINLKKDIKDNNEIVVQHSKIEKEIESSQNEIMKDLEKHLDLQDIKLTSNINTGNLNPNEVKEATYIKKTIEIITTSSDGKLIDDGNKDFNSKSKNEVVNNTTITKTSLVNQIDESSKPEIKEKTENFENFTNNEEKTTKVTIIKEDNSSVVNNKEITEEKKEEIKEEKKEEIKEEKKEEITEERKEEIKDVQAQNEIFSETKVIKTTEKTEENVESELPKFKPEIEFKKDTKITTTTTTNLKTEPILPRQQFQQTEVNKLSEIISKSRQTRNEVINKRRQTPNQIILRGRRTPNLTINTGRQSPNKYLFSKTTTTTTNVTDNPITSILDKRNNEIYGTSSTTTNRRFQHITSTLPQITETLGNRRQIGVNQTSSILTNMRKIEPYNFKKERYDFNKVTISDERQLRNEKSTPALRGGVTKSITDFRKPLNTTSLTSEILNNNLSTVSIFDTGKKQKREYVLNVRKTDVIQPRNKISLRYTNNPDNEFINTDFNLRSKIVRNLSKEHNNSSYLPNTVYHEINETKKHEKKEVQVAPRKYLVIKTKRKPYKYTYTISNTEQPLFRNSIRNSTINENDNSLLRVRNSNPDPLNKSSYQLSKTNYSTGLNLTSSHNFYNKTKYEPISHRSKYETNTTITSRISDVRNNRNKVSYVPLTAGNSKSNLFKTTETRITNTSTNTNTNSNTITNTRNQHRFNRIVRDSGNKNYLNSNKVLSIKTNKAIIDLGTKNDIEINKDITKDIKKDINIEIKKEINKDITKDVNIEINKDINKDITKDVNIEINKEINKDIINTDNTKDINNSGYTKNEEKITKIVIEGATSSVQNSGSDALTLKEAKDVELVNKNENQVGLIKREVSSTITTKEITIESSIQKDGTETQYKQQSRFIRMEKKEE